MMDDASKKYIADGVKLLDGVMLGNSLVVELPRETILAQLAYAWQQIDRLESQPEREIPCKPNQQ